MSEKTSHLNSMLSVIGTLVAVGGLYLGYLQLIKQDPPVAEPIQVDPAWQIKAARIQELRNQITELDNSIAAYEDRKRNLQAEISVLYQADETTLSTEELRQLVKNREDAARNLRELNAIIDEKKIERNNLQQKLDTMVN